MYKLAVSGIGVNPQASLQTSYIGAKILGVNSNFQTRPRCIAKPIAVCAALLAAALRWLTAKAISSAAPRRENRPQPIAV